MYLDPYVVEVTQPNKWRYFPYTYQKNLPREIDQATLTLDIVKTTTNIHSLISYPVWGDFSMWNELPSICKHIFHFMQLSGWATKDKALWYVLDWFDSRMIINQVSFKEENWNQYEQKTLTPPQTPFNLREIENL